jgi:carbamoyltransferase
MKLVYLGAGATEEQNEDAAYQNTGFGAELKRTLKNDCGDGYMKLNAKAGIFKTLAITVCFSLFFTNGGSLAYSMSTGDTAFTNANLSGWSVFKKTHGMQEFSSTNDPSQWINNPGYILAMTGIAEFMVMHKACPAALDKYITRGLMGEVSAQARHISKNAEIIVRGTQIQFVFSTESGKHTFSIRLEKAPDGRIRKYSLDYTGPDGRENLPQPDTSDPDRKSVIKVGYSVLSSDPDKIHEEIKHAVRCGIDRVHLDHLDGKFVPGILPFDCQAQIEAISAVDIGKHVHLMVNEPGPELIDRLAGAGLHKRRDSIAVHYEAFSDKSDLIAIARYIHKRGYRVGIVLNPETQPVVLDPFLTELEDILDNITVMSIMPGAGSRPFIQGTLEKVAPLRDMLRSHGMYGVTIIADGGLNEESLPEIIGSGVDVLTTRTWLLKGSKGFEGGIEYIKNLSEQNIQLITLKSFLQKWGLWDYRDMISSIADFCKGGSPISSEELKSAIGHLEGIKRVDIEEDGVIEIRYADKLLRVHSKQTVPIEHMGLQDRAYYDDVVFKVYMGNTIREPKGEYILGISGTWHDSTAVLVKDGKIIAALEEERITRVKHDPSLFPVNAIKRMMSQLHINWSDVRHVAFGWDFNRYVDTPHSVNPNQRFFDEMDDAYTADYLARAEKDNALLEMLFNRDDDGRPTIERRRSCEQNKKRFDVGEVQSFLDDMNRYSKDKHGTSDHEPLVSFVSHTRAHAASAYYPSGFYGKDDRVLAIALDGYGDTESGSVWIGENGKMTQLEQFKLPHSIGWMYATITEYLGFKPSSEEGQVMGFAPYGEPVDAVEFQRVNDLFRFFEEFMTFDEENGKLVSSPEFYYYGKMWNDKKRITELLRKRLSELGIEPANPGFGNTIKDPINQTEVRPYANLAFVLQKHTEQLVLSTVKYYMKKHADTKGITKLALAGGINLNILSNSRLISERLVYGEDIFVQPASGDSGTAIGAALCVADEIYGDKVTNEMVHASYGPEYSNGEIEEVLRSYGLREGKDYTRLTDEQLAENAASHIEHGAALAWFQGRSELGPRALLNRSFVFDATDVINTDSANKAKGRQPWRPSATSITQERAKHYFKGLGEGKSPFMVIAFPVLRSNKDNILSGLHTAGDRQARPQTVSAETNPLAHAFLEHLGKKIGTPAVVNTSFNHQEPIVEHPVEALDTFYYTDEKVSQLYMGNFVIKRSLNLLPRVVSLTLDARYKGLAKEAVLKGDISKWIKLFELIAKDNPRCHYLNATVNAGSSSEKTLSIPLIKEMFSGPMQDAVLSFSAAMVNNHIVEFKANSVNIDTTFDKMTDVVYPLIAERIKKDYPRMSFFANNGNPVTLSSSAVSSRKETGTRRTRSFLMKNLSDSEKTGMYVGIDVGASRIKGILIKNGIALKTTVITLDQADFSGGKTLGLRIKEIASELAGGETEIDGLGIGLPGVVDTFSNDVLWLVHYEKIWKDSGISDIEQQYRDLSEEISSIEKTYGPWKTWLLNDGTAFGINAINKSDIDNAIVVTIGTGIGVSRIEKGAIDISSIEQSGGFAVDVSPDAAMDNSCGVKGCFAFGLRDENGNRLPHAELAKKIVSWMNLMRALRGDRNFIFSGGYLHSGYGEDLISSINSILSEEGMEKTFKVSMSALDLSFSGAEGAAQFAMKRCPRKTMDAIHRINSVLVNSPPKTTKAHYIIAEELIPVTMRSSFQSLIRRLYAQYAFIKDKEEIHVVKSANITSFLAALSDQEKESGKQVNFVIAAVDENTLFGLPDKAGALLFTGMDESQNFVQLEGILASLRALHHKNVTLLLELYSLLTGERIDHLFSKREAISDLLLSPADLVKILRFNLKPITVLSKSLTLINTLLGYIETSV